MPELRENHTIMAELKTKRTDASVQEFIHAFAQTDQKIADSYALLQLMQDATGHPPKMWGASIIGFGQYHYKSDRSRQEGDWPMVGFSPRKAAISLYVYSGQPEQQALLERLGKYTMGKSCIYVKRLSDIDQSVLIQMIKSSVDFLQKKYG